MKKFRKTHLEKAGAILIRKKNGKKEILLEYRSRDYGDWTFPKGDIEKDETSEQTAKRELKEETGFNVKLIRKLPDINYEFEQGGKIHHVKQHMFLAQIIDGHLTPEFKYDGLRWVKIEEAAGVLTHQDLKDYLAKIKPKLILEKTF